MQALQRNSQPVARPPLTVLRNRSRLVRMQPMHPRHGSMPRSNSAIQASGTVEPSGRTMRVQVDVWSDLACPWCHVGYQGLDKALQKWAQDTSNPEVQVNWHSFVIDPATQPEGEEYHAYNVRRWGGDGWTHALRRSGKPDGATFSNWITWPNSMKAHEVIKIAESQAGKGGQAKGLLLHHTYERGGNISLIPELVALRQELGLSDVEASLTSGAYRGAVRNDDLMGKKEMRISGVPCYVVKVVETADEDKVDFKAMEGASASTNTDSLAGDGGVGALQVLAEGRQVASPPVEGKSYVLGGAQPSTTLVAALYRALEEFRRDRGAAGCVESLAGGEKCSDGGCA
eukprot:gene4953-34732_t